MNSLYKNSLRKIKSLVSRVVNEPAFRIRRFHNLSFDLGIDSLDMAVLESYIENVFKIDISSDWSFPPYCRTEKIIPLSNTIPSHTVHTLTRYVCSEILKNSVTKPQSQLLP